MRTPSVILMSDIRRSLAPEPSSSFDIELEENRRLSRSEEVGPDKELAATNHCMGRGLRAHISANTWRGPTEINPIVKCVASNL